MIVLPFCTSMMTSVRRSAKGLAKLEDSARRARRTPAMDAAEEATAEHASPMTNTSTGLPKIGRGSEKESEGE